MLTDVKILVVEDNFPDFILVKEILLQAGIAEENIQYAGRLSEIPEKRQQRQPDIVLLDLGLPDSNGIETFHKAYQLAGDAAIILLSGLTDTEVALETIKLGAQDYLVKGEIDDRLLQKTIKYAIERKRIFDALLRSEERYKYLIDTVNEGIVMTDREFELIYFNDQFAHLTGINKRDLIKSTLYDLAREIMDEQNRALYFSHLDAHQSNEAKDSFEVKIKNKSGEEYWLLIRANSMCDKEGKFWGEISAWIDITPIKKAKEELINAVLEAQEKEKKRIAQDLHDGLGQVLAATQMNFNSLSRDCFSGENEVYFNRIKELLGKSITDVRSISHNLMPLEIETLGFVKTIELLVNRMESLTGISLRFFTNQPNFTPEQQLSTHLYRIIQEFISNSIKHGNAKEIDIEIEHSRSKINIYLRDDGKGFNVEKVLDKSTSKGIGLTNILNRISLMGAIHRLYSAPGEGTLLEIVLEKK